MVNKKKILLVALGGNALIKKGQEGTTEQQFNNLIDPASDSQPIFILKTMVAAAMADG